MKKTIFLFLFIILGLSTAYAEILTFNSKPAFQAAVSDYGYCYRVINFDSGMQGTEYPTGSTMNDVQFIYSLPENLIIDNTWAATSGSNYLGVSGDNAFSSGDRLELFFRKTVYAIGLYVLGSPGDIFGDDFELHAGNMSAPNFSHPGLVLQDGSEAFFIGIVDTDSGSGFSKATLLNIYFGGEYEFHIDDIIYGIETIREADEDGDCDVDGMDLAILAHRPFTEDDLADFAAHYGK